MAQKSWSFLSEQQTAVQRGSQACPWVCYTSMAVQLRRMDDVPLVQDRDQVRPRTWWVPESLYGAEEDLGVREEHGSQLQVTVAG